MFQKISLVTLLMITTLSANNNIKPLIQMGYDWGGTTLVTVHHDHENDYTIRAGDGLNLEVGATVGNPNLELQFLVGYKFDTDSASNGDVTWDTVPFTAIGMLKNNRWKFGGGVTYHLNPELSGSFSGYDGGVYFNDNVDDEYENALGGVVKIQYQAGDSFDIGLQGTFIEYELKSDNTQTAKGNSIGVVFTYTFGNERSEFR
jgi:hypothetical protein